MDDVIGDLDFDTNIVELFDEEGELRGVILGVGGYVVVELGDFFIFGPELSIDEFLEVLGLELELFGELINPDILLLDFDILGGEFLEKVLVGDGGLDVFKL